MQILYILITILISLTLSSPVQGYMPLDKAAEAVKKVVEGKASPWAIRDPKVKVKPRPILSKKHMQEMTESRTRVDSTEPTMATGLKFVDLREFDTPVKNQEDRGWCTSFATIATMENIAKQEGRTIDLSEIYLWNQYKEYDMYVAAEASTKTFIISEKEWPYHAARPSKGYKEKGLAKTKAVAEMTAVDEAIASLDKKRPIVFAAETNPYWGSPNKGVIAVKGPAEGGHAIAVVGYFLDPTNESMGGGFLIFKNSWGPDWGDKGYGYLPFSYCKKYSCYFIRNEGVLLK
jgi:C1A family cysteine protease